MKKSSSTSMRNSEFVTVTHMHRHQLHQTQIISILTTVTPKLFLEAWNCKHYRDSLLKTKVHWHRERITGNILFTQCSLMIPTQWRGRHSAFQQLILAAHLHLWLTVTGKIFSQSCNINVFKRKSKIPWVTEKLTNLCGNVLWNLLLGKFPAWINYFSS